MSWNYYGFRPYVSVAERQRRAQKELAKLAKKGLMVQPIRIEGRTIARSFWGKAWCDNLESYMDYANRLPRGRTYVRNGSVVHLDVKPGYVEAMVSGTELYRVKISITPVAEPKWKCLCRECAGGIGSLVELLQGRLSDRVMDIITRRETGLFPAPREVKMNCSCPDSAGLCKHLAAVFYGIGARLDEAPELLFVLRSVDHQELITQAADVSELTAKSVEGAPELSEAEAANVFGIEIDSAAPAVAEVAKPEPARPPERPKRRPDPSARKPKAKAKRKVAKALRKKIRPPVSL
ncbi:MAG: SWIM zinc finger family protein [Verrucomicrobiia bacterium]